MKGLGNENKIDIETNDNMLYEDGKTMDVYVSPRGESGGFEEMYNMQFDGSDVRDSKFNTIRDNEGTEIRSNDVYRLDYKN